MTQDRFEQQAADLLADWGQRLRLRRRELGLTVQEVADQLVLNRATVQNWELGKSRPGTPFIFAIAELLKVEVEDLFPADPAAAVKRAEVAPMLLELADLFRSRELDPAELDVVADSLEFIATKLFDR